MRRLKSLSVLVALGCMLGVCATPALALEYEASPEKYTDTTAEFGILNEAGNETVGQVKCDATTLKLNTKGKATTLNVTPNFSGCNTTIEKVGKEIVTNVTNECKEGVQLNQPEELGEEPGHGLYRSTVTLLKGCKIILSPVLKSACEVKIEGPQEQLKYAYYNGITPINLGEPESVAELGKVKDTASGFGCSLAGIPATGTLQVQVGRTPHFVAANNDYGGVNGYKPTLKNVTPGNTKLTQEFTWSTEGNVICEEAEYETNSLFANVNSNAVYVKPSLNMCKIREQGAMPVNATATIPANCRLRLGNVQGTSPNHTGNLEVLSACNEIKFASTTCKLKIVQGGQQPGVKYKNTSSVGRGEMEVAFEVGGLASGAIETCPNVKGSTVKYTGTMLYKELYILP